MHLMVLTHLHYQETLVDFQMFQLQLLIMQIAEQVQKVLLQLNYKHQEITQHKIELLHQMIIKL